MHAAELIHHYKKKMCTKYVPVLCKVTKHITRQTNKANLHTVKWKFPIPLPPPSYGEWSPWWSLQEHDATSSHIWSAHSCFAGSNDIPPIPATAFPSDDCLSDSCRRPHQWCPAIAVSPSDDAWWNDSLSARGPWRHWRCGTAFPGHKPCVPHRWNLLTSPAIFKHNKLYW